MQMLLGSGTYPYLLQRSLRFRASASAYLNRTMGTPTNNKIWTISTWVKRGTLSSGALQSLFVANATGSAYWGLSFTTTDNLYIFDGYNATSTVQTSAVYRDSASWYHIVVAVDTTQATASNRFKLYVNGSQVTAFSTATYPAQNLNTQWNAASQLCSIGRDSVNGRYFDGYIAETHFVDGQALTPASFGETNALTGVWQPTPYSGGSYGANGFYLDFETTTSVAALGNDKSGNGNTWTVNNISLTAGVTYDSMTDVPTLTSATAANYAVLNPLKVNATNPPTITNGNLQTLTAATNFGITFGTIGASTGKFYWEITPTSLTGGGSIGVANDSAALDQFLGQNANGWSYYNDGTKYNNNSATAYGASYAANDVIGVALDMSAGTLVFYKNNTSQGTAFSGLTGTLFPAMSDGSGAGTATFVANFGQRPFAYTPPTGFVALNTFNLPTSTIVKGNTVMDATTYTGNGSTQTITNAAGFQSDLIWIKSRSATTYNILTDSVRGTNSQLFSNDTLAQEARIDRITAFNSNGFSLGNYNDVNTNAATYVGWQWQAGQGTTSSNTSGTITSTVSVNPTAGFSVVAYTGNGTNGASVGHGLGVTPAMVVIKRRDSTGSWIGWHRSVSQAIQTSSTIGLTGYTGALYLNLNNAASTYVFDAQINGSGGTYVAYCWSQISGYSSFGSYVGNGSTAGPFVYLGFRPAFVMVKASSTTSNWSIMDNKRPAPYNSIPASGLLYPNLTNAEGGTGNWIDFLSNGFKIVNAFGDSNSSGVTYIYMAFAENPFKNSLAR